MNEELLNEEIAAPVLKTEINGRWELPCRSFDIPLSTKVGAKIH
jgi:hypothetical protein